MVVEVKSICCVESLRKIPEIFGLEKGKISTATSSICDVVLFGEIDFDCKLRVFFRNQLVK